MKPAEKSKLRRLGILSGISLLIFLFGLNSSAVEYIYSNHVYQYISVSQRLISSFLSFALGDFLYAALVVFCLWSVIRAVRKVISKQAGEKTGLNISLQLANFILILYIVFKLLWGLNYSRPSISDTLAIDDKKYNTHELVMLGDFLIQKVNTIEQKLNMQKAKRIYSVRELQAGSKTAYDELAKSNSFFSYHVPSVKPVIFSWLITKIGIEGYYCPLSGEANVNMMTPAVTLPFITCHEISHTLGVAREDEANLVGYLVSIHSKDLNFQYAGYYEILRSVLFEIRIKSPDDFAILFKKINAGTLADFKAEQEFWKKYNGDMAAYMNTALDSFLKINNQKKGTDSYQDIVLWAFNYHEAEIRKTLQASHK